MKRIALFLGALFCSITLMAQTPQEVKQLRELVGGFAYASSVEQVSAEECKITFSSGENFTLLCGSKKDKNKPFKTLDVKDDVLIAKPHKGKPIVISRKLDQASALMAIYKQTNGKAWTRNEGWGNTKQGLDTWDGITCDSEGNVTHIKLGNNNLQGELPDVFYAFPKLQQVVLNKNQLTGNVPRSLAWLPEKCKANIRHNKFKQTTLYVPKHRLASVAQSIKCYPQQEEYKEFRLFIDCDADLNPTRGYYADNECRLYHKATEGRGVNIYVVGDGYDKAEYAIGGTAEYWLERAADAIFEVEPYKQLKHLFNVYIIYAYSPERGMNLINSTRNSRFGFWIKKEKGIKSPLCNAQEIFDTCKNSVTNAGFEFEAGIPHVEVVGNCTRGGAYAWSRSVIDGDSKRKIRFAINPAASEGFNRLVWHEFCGHTFGALRDEYSNKGGLNKTYKKKTTSANVDTESDPKKVKWAKFIEDPRYADEKLGVYQGSLNCANLYRATETSIMKSHRPGLKFNAPSREAIYKKVMSMAYPDWKYDYEEFVKFDMGDKYYPLTNN